MVLIFSGDLGDSSQRDLLCTLRVVDQLLTRNPYGCGSFLKGAQLLNGLIFPKFPSSGKYPIGYHCSHPSTKE